MIPALALAAGLSLPPVTPQVQPIRPDVISFVKHRPALIVGVACFAVGMAHSAPMQPSNFVWQPFALPRLKIPGRQFMHVMFVPGIVVSTGLLTVIAEAIFSPSKPK